MKRSFSKKQWAWLLADLRESPLKGGETIEDVAKLMDRVVNRHEGCRKKTQLPEHHLVYALLQAAGYQVDPVERKVKVREDAGQASDAGGKGSSDGGAVQPMPVPGEDRATAGPASADREDVPRSGE